MSKKLRAVYSGDVRFDVCPVFELNEATGYYECLQDRQFRHSVDCVYGDTDFIIFEIKDDLVKVIR